MRFGVVHRLMTNALAALGVLALVSSGQFSLPISVIVLVGLVLALSVRETWQRHPAFRHVDTIALLAVIGLQVTRFALGVVNSLDVLIEFAAALQLVRLATRRGAAHDQQVIVLALLHLIAGTVLGGGLGYGLCFAGVLIVAPGALVLSHLRREVEGNYRQGARDRTGLPVDVPRILRSRRVVGRTFLVTMCLLAVPIFVFTAVLFVFFPRVGLSLLLVQNPQSDPVIGFSPKVDLGKVGVLRENRTVALRVKLPNQPDPPPQVIQLHLRGTGLDRYEGGGTWSQSERPSGPEMEGFTPVVVEPGARFTKGQPAMQIELEAIDPPVLFLPPNAAAFEFRTKDLALSNERRPYAQRRPEGEFRYAGEERGVSYDVYRHDNGRQAFTRLDASARERYLRVPELPDRIAALAREWTAGAETPRDKVLAIEAKLKAEYRWALDTPSKKASEPLDHFLFDSKVGHCEFFSTALAVLLRYVDVPTRTVNGYASGKWNSYGGFYVVRQGDAHSWVEVYLDGVGWTTFDPTPAAGSGPAGELSQPWAAIADAVDALGQRWRRNVIGYDFQQQKGMWDRLTEEEREQQAGDRRQALPWIVLGVVAAVLAAWLLRRRKPGEKLGEEAPIKSRHLARATAIYETLETALAAQGVFRSPGTPPLRHAENMAASSHPLADEVLDITKVYLSVRFGGMALSDDVAGDLEKRVRSIRTRNLRAPP